MVVYKKCAHYKVFKNQPDMLKIVWHENKVFSNQETFLNFLRKWTVPANFFEIFQEIHLKMKGPVKSKAMQV